MANQKMDRGLSKFIAQIQAANNLITEQQATELYHVRDAMLALSAFKPGQRIVIDKSKTDTTL